MSFVDKLKGSGAPENQVKSLVDSITKSDISQLASKADITSIRKDIDALENKMLNENASLIKLIKKNLLVQTAIIIILQTIILIAAIKLLG